MNVKMIEASHYLTQREPEGEIYCSRCGLYSPSEEDSCISMRIEVPEKAA